jgi:acyl-CoA thioesterase II
MSSHLAAILTLETLAKDRFRASSHRENFQSHLFGGQVLAQGLMAAGKTVDLSIFAPHSLHAYFLRPGSSRSTIDYQVTLARDGQRFCTRHIEAWQESRVIFSLTASFHVEEQGFSHAKHWEPAPLPEASAVVPPRELAVDNAAIQEASFEFFPVVGDFISAELQEPKTAFWIRAAEAIPDEPIWHAAALAYASDFGLLATSLNCHPASLFAGHVVAASVDHALWLHQRRFNVAEWFCYQIQSPWASSARGLSQGFLYDTAGNLLASSAQEGLIRPKPQT